MGRGKRRREKRPHVAGSGPKPEKQPRVAPQPDFDQLSPNWQFALVDDDGCQWSWCHATRAELLAIRTRLSNLEKSTWQAIKQAGKGHNSHNVKLDRLTGAARKRLRDLKLDDNDEVFSLYLTSRERIWGFLRGQTLQILWWDPRHEVCPSVKKHT